MALTPVATLARQAEEILVAVARESAEPITAADLATRLAGEDEKPVPNRQMVKVLTEMRERRGSWSWTPFLAAWVVDPETGEPDNEYFVTGLGDAAAVRAKTHERLVKGVYDTSPPRR